MRRSRKPVYVFGVSRVRIPPPPLGASPQQYALIVGFLDKIKEKGRGVVTAAKPEAGVVPQPADEVRRRLLTISGKGIEVSEDGGEIVVMWSAKVTVAGSIGAHSKYMYRALRIDLNEDEHEAKGLGLSTTKTKELGTVGVFAGWSSWDRGQPVGGETVHVLAWLGPHQTEGGADEKGFKFSWSDLREPVIEAVTGAGWTYKPKAV